MADKAHIEGSVMGNQYSISHKVQKTRQNNVHRRGIHHHRIIDPRQTLDLKGDRNLRIDKFIHPVYDHAVLHLDGSDLYDLVFYR